MIQLNSIIKAADNSGAKAVRCIGLLPKKSRNPFGGLLFRGVVQSTYQTKSSAHLRAQRLVRKSDLVLCLLVRSKRGSLRFSDNSCILLDDQLRPRRNRIFGPVSFPKIFANASARGKGLYSKAPRKLLRTILSNVKSKNRVFFV